MTALTVREASALVARGAREAEARRQAAVRREADEQDQLDPARVLVDGPMASAWTGRPESTLRRWVHEHRITRYGSPGVAMYDLDELPARSTGGVPARRTLGSGGPGSSDGQSTV